MSKTVKDKRRVVTGREVCEVEGLEALMSALRSLRVGGCTMTKDMAAGLAGDIVDEGAELFTENPLRYAYEHWGMKGELI